MRVVVSRFGHVESRVDRPSLSLHPCCAVLHLDCVWLVIWKLAGHWDDFERFCWPTAVTLHRSDLMLMQS